MANECVLSLLNLVRANAICVGMSTTKINSYTTCTVYIPSNLTTILFCCVLLFEAIQLGVLYPILLIIYIDHACSSPWYSYDQWCVQKHVQYRVD